MKYHIGQYIMYGNTGVCRIEAIGKLKFLPGCEKEYYTLRPPFTTTNERIYIPVKAEEELKMAMTQDEAVEQLVCLKKMQIKPSRSTKVSLLEAHYRELLSANDVEKHLQLFKEICEKEEQTMEKGRKLGETERRFKRKVEHLLSEEFAVALNESSASSTKRLYMAVG